MGAQSLAVACGALALCLTLAKPIDPGFVVRITQAGLDYARQQGMVILEKRLATLNLSDFSGDYNLTLVGEVHYELSGLKLQNFRLPDSRISLVPNVGLQVSISNALANVNGNWLLRKKIQNHGSFNVTVEGVNINIDLKLGNDAAGKPTVDTSGCSIQVSKVQVHFSGGLAWLCNLFHEVIEYKLRKILESTVCDIVAKSVRSDLQPYIQTLPVTAKISSIAGVDYSLVRPPTTTAQSLDVAMKGECYSLAKRSTIPFSPPRLTLPPDHDRMVYFGVSSYFFNSASFVYHKAGALVYEFTDSMIPKTVDFHLKTSTFSAFVPQLKEIYPGMRMKLRLSAPSAPCLSIRPGVLSLKPVVDIQAYAILPNSSLASLFHLSVTGNMSIVINVISGHITGNLKMGRMKLSLEHSNVGGFQIETLQSMMNFIASSILLPRVNERLGQGFPLPMPKGMLPSNILVAFHQDLLLLGANIRYQSQV